MDLPPRSDSQVRGLNLFSRQGGRGRKRALCAGAAGSVVGQTRIVIADRSEARFHDAEATVDRWAADAVSLFCYQARRWIGAIAATFGGSLIFAGGIGENATLIRERICAELGFPGMQVDQIRKTIPNAVDVAAALARQFMAAAAPGAAPGGGPP